VDEDQGEDGMALMTLNPRLKDLAKDIFYYSGLSRMLLSFSCYRRHPKLLILTYHKVCLPSRSDGYLGIPEDAFEQHVRFIKDNFKTVSMQDGLKALHEGDSSDIYATINFDDGYMDNYLYAYPVLKKYKVPATVFLTTDFVGKEHIFWWDKVFKIIPSSDTNDIDKTQAAERINFSLRTKSESEIQAVIQKLEERFQPQGKIEPVLMLGWKEIKEMKTNGIDFGAHTKTHRNLCMLNDDEVLEELIGSKKEIEEKIGDEIKGFSYPFGIFDERVKGLVRKAGFEYARSTLKGFNHKNVDRFLLASIGGGGLLKTSFLAARISVNSLKPGMEIYR